MSQIRVMGGGVKLIETMSQNMQFFFWTASLRNNLETFWNPLETFRDPQRKFWEILEIPWKQFGIIYCL